MELQLIRAAGQVPEARVKPISKAAGGARSGKDGMIWKQVGRLMQGKGVLVLFNEQVAKIP